MTCAGDGGAVVIRADELDLLNGADIFTAPFGPGRGGSVQIDVTGTLLIEGITSQNIYEPTTGITTSPTDMLSKQTGPAGEIAINAGNLAIGQNGIISSSSYSDAPASPITLDVGSLELKNGGKIRSTASGAGRGGDVVVTAQDSVYIHHSDPVYLLSDSSIITDVGFSDTDGEGGSIRIEAPLLCLEHGGEITSETHGGGKGGSIDIIVDDLTLTSGGTVTTSSSGKGDAGSIRIDTISAAFNNEPVNGVHPSTGLFSEAKIGAAGNAGKIDVSFEKSLALLGGAKISTQAETGDGGDIVVNGPGYLMLSNGLISTSTEGGVGGNISLNQKNLVLDTGFIQANTSYGAEGGAIYIESDAVVAESGLVDIGGEERLSFTPGSGLNVIQAAAPEGNPGNIVIASPELDISSVLTGLDARIAEEVQLASDPCIAAGTTTASSLIVTGAGGVPAGFNRYSVLSYGENRLDNILNFERERD